MNRYLAARRRTIGLSARSLHIILDQQDTHITSMKNEKYKLFKAVRDSARTRKKTGLRFFEGYRLVKDALANGFTPEEVFMSADMIKSQHGKIIADLLLDLERGGKGAVRPYCVDDILLNTLSETVQPQSVFALFKAPAVETDEAIEYYLRQQAKKRLMSPSCVHSAMILLCDGVSDPGNIGTLVRSSVGFGADAVIVVGGCDPWASKAVRSSMGTCLRIPVVQLKQAAQLVPRLLYPTLQLGVPKSDPSGGAIIVYIASAEIVDIVIPGASIPYDEADFTIPFVLVVGSEASGVSDELYAELAANSATVKVVHLHIPMVATGMDSFNAAVAGSVVLAEAARQRRCALSSR